MARELLFAVAMVGMSARRIWGRVRWLVPVVVLAQLAAVGGVRTADACSGGVPSEGWSNLRVPIHSGEERLPIASDGFVLLHGGYVTDDPETEVPLPLVRATNEAGDEVAGELKVLRTQDAQGMIFVHLGWQASEPLAEGSMLTLSFAGGDEGDEGGAGAGGAGAAAPLAYKTVELEVVGEPTPLPTPTAALGDWVEVRHGVGELAECVDDSTGCGASLLQVPSDEERVPGVGVEWTLPSINGVVAWEVWAETSDASDAALPPTSTPAQLVDREREVIPSVHDIVAFASDASEHCAVIVVKDLRTGQVARSEPQCEEPGTPTVTLADHHLGSCAEPPTPESTALWCLNHTEDERCEGIDPGGMSGQGGREGGGEPEPDGETPRGGSKPVDSDPQGDEAAAKRRTSSGCSYSPTNGSLWLGAATIGLGLFASNRRRRKQRG